MNKGQITISRLNKSNEVKKIEIKIKDSNSRINFLTLELDYDKFAELMTGLAFVECDLSFNDLENIGKKIEKKDIIFELPKSRHLLTDKEVEMIAKINTPDDWICMNCFRSSNSFLKKDGKYFAKTKIKRYI